jgi:hypothetical protein
MRAKWTGGTAQEVECPLRKWEALRSNPNHTLTHTLKLDTKSIKGNNGKQDLMRIKMFVLQKPC